ncbi:unnamed protein product [Amoebophrya sp. A25]|nr:unnamed protein product [Amoebophrya sp. A25]|eukprot:GSA25T00027187001.1
MSEFDSFVKTAVAMAGEDVDPEWLKELWDGADGDANRAVNHLLDTPENKFRRKAASASAPAAPEKKKKQKRSSSNDPPAAASAPPAATSTLNFEPVGPGLSATGPAGMMGVANSGGGRNFHQNPMGPGPGGVPEMASMAGMNYGGMSAPPAPGNYGALANNYMPAGAMPMQQSALVGGYGMPPQANNFYPGVSSGASGMYPGNPGVPQQGLPASAMSAGHAACRFSSTSGGQNGFQGANSYVPFPGEQQQQQSVGQVPQRNPGSPVGAGKIDDGARGVLSGVSAMPSLPLEAMAEKQTNLQAQLFTQQQMMSNMRNIMLLQQFKNRLRLKDNGKEWWKTEVGEDELRVLEGGNPFLGASRARRSSVSVDGRKKQSSATSAPAGEQGVEHQARAIGARGSAATSLMSSTRNSPLAAHAVAPSAATVSVSRKKEAKEGKARKVEKIVNYILSGKDCSDQASRSSSKTCSLLQSSPVGQAQLPPSTPRRLKQKAEAMLFDLLGEAGEQEIVAGSGVNSSSTSRQQVVDPRAVLLLLEDSALGQQRRGGANGATMLKTPTRGSPKLGSARATPPEMTKTSKNLQGSSNVSSAAKQGGSPTENMALASPSGAVGMGMISNTGAFGGLRVMRNLLAQLEEATCANEDKAELARADDNCERQSVRDLLRELKEKAINRDSTAGLGHGSASSGSEVAGGGSAAPSFATGGSGPGMQMIARGGTANRATSSTSSASSSSGAAHISVVDTKKTDAYEAAWRNFVASENTEAGTSALMGSPKPVVTTSRYFDPMPGYMTLLLPKSEVTNEPRPVSPALGLILPRSAEQHSALLGRGAQQPFPHPVEQNPQQAGLLALQQQQALLAASAQQQQQQQQQQSLLALRQQQEQAELLRRQQEQQQLAALQEAELLRQQQAEAVRQQQIAALQEAERQQALLKQAEAERAAQFLAAQQQQQQQAAALAALELQRQQQQQAQAQAHLNMLQQQQAQQLEKDRLTTALLLQQQQDPSLGGGLAGSYGLGQVADYFSVDGVRQPSLLDPGRIDSRATLGNSMGWAMMQC